MRAMSFKEGMSSNECFGKFKAGGKKDLMQSEPASLAALVEELENCTALTSTYFQMSSEDLRTREGLIHAEMSSELSEVPILPLFLKLIKPAPVINQKCVQELAPTAG